MIHLMEKNTIIFKQRVKKQGDGVALTAREILTRNIKLLTW